MNDRPVALGTGLLALDLIISRESPPFTMPGGSCGNVLSFLAHLGWTSYPVGRLGADATAQWLISGLKEAGVCVDYVSQEPTGSTPVIVQRVSRDASGAPTHRFERVCPTCQAWFPSFRPILVKSASVLRTELPAPRVFYFDRPSPGALVLAKWAREAGALVVFEPPRLREDRHHAAAVEHSHVVKVAASHRGDDLDALLPALFADNVPVVIETLGADGLRFKIGGDDHWSDLGAFKVGPIVDSAGAGDWTTAGLVHQLLTSPTSFPALDRATVSDALRFGQALAGINCLFLGATGAMRALGRDDIGRLALDLVKVEAPPVCEVPIRSNAQALEVCPYCSERSIVAG